jgi:hypothetical protein
MPDKSILIRLEELRPPKSRKKIPIPLLLLFGTFATAHGQTPLRVVLTTGSDELRRGNSVFVKPNFTDGRSSTETRMRVPTHGLSQNVTLWDRHSPAISFGRCRAAGSGAAGSATADTERHHTA